MPAAEPGRAGAARVAIVGRPNVGKSTLFNRLVGRRLALVDDKPGVTRDRREGDARLGPLAFRVIDTAGLEEADDATLQGRMLAQTEAAIAQSDAVLFLMDARAGVTPSDRHFADLVRRAGKPVVLIANKAEGRRGLEGAYEAFALGLGDPLPFSAEHGEGLGGLVEALTAALGDGAETPDGMEDDAAPAIAGRPLQVAVIGRPNSGKSTLINRMIGAERLLTGPEAGITRDAIALDWEWGGRAIRLFDTAGLRKRARVTEKLEKLAASDALNAVRFAEVVVVLVDATAPFEKQDLALVDLVEEEGRAIVIALNKWDLVDEPQGLLKRLRAEADRLLPQVKGAAVVPVSGLAGEGIDRLMKAVIETYEVWNRRIATARLNQWLGRALEDHPPPAVSGRRIKIRYMTQAKARPPSFVLFGNQLEALPKAYTRYLVNGLRSAFDLPGVPIRIALRTGGNPFDKRKRR